MIAAAALCPAPPLLARELTGADPVVPELRQACLSAVDELVRERPDLVVVVGAGKITSPFDAAARLDLSAFAPGIASISSNAAPALPVSLGLGAMLLDQAGYTGPRQMWSVAMQEPADHCAELGSMIAGLAERVALLTMADGSARRGQKAPGHFDGRSAGFDAEVEQAVRTGDLACLLALDQQVARELMATGRAAWQVMAGALRGQRPVSKVGYSDAPFGVAYLVASLSLPIPVREDR